MAGSVIRVQRRRVFNFGAVSIGQSQEVVIAHGIDVSEWPDVAIGVRAHSTNFGGALGNVQIYAYCDGRTDEDPNILFATTTPLGVATIDNTTVTPAYMIRSLGPNLGGLIKIAAKGTRTSSASNNNISATVSVDVFCKSV
jgi:hypothetical protein